MSIITFHSLSEDTMIIYLGDQINTLIANRVKLASDVIRLNYSNVIIDLIPSYASIHISYDWMNIDYDELKPLLSQLLKQTLNHPLPSSYRCLPTCHEIPVYYSVDTGIDLLSIAQAKNITTETIIQWHSQPTYQIYAMGFSLGFAYMGALDSRLFMPRMKTPRRNVPAGSVAIAEQQTAVYPLDSPAGWHIIGKTPFLLRDDRYIDLTPFKVGDHVQFKPISQSHFLSLGGQL